MRRAAIALTGTLAVVGAVVATGPGGVGTADATPTTRLATPTVVDPTSIYGEPDLRADPAHPGVWYASGPWGTGTQRSIWDRSLDGAHTFRALHDHPDPVHTGESMTPPGGGDTEIAVDHTGKVYMADLAALESQKAYTSTDMGATFAEQPLPPVFDDTKGTDRQWFGLWDPPAGTPVRSAYKGPWPVNYMVYLKAGATQTSNAETVASSVPNGADQSRVGLDYACAPGAVGGGACPQWPLGNDGYVAIDQVTGRVVQAIGTTDAAGHDHIGVEVMTPGANGYMATATYHDVADLGHQNVGSIFPVITMDAARNVYAVWIANPDTDTDYVPGTSWQVFYSVARADAHDDWTQWSRPRRISAAPSNTSVMPWAVAGGDGNLDVAWYGTPSVLKRFDSESDPTVQKASWYLDMAQVTGATSGHPSTQQVQVVDRPMHHGSICLAGLGCITETGNRNLADFFEITTDASGAAYIVYDNTANDLIQQVPLTETGLPEGVVDHRGAEIVMVARQIGGPSLNGGSVDAPDDHGVSGIRSAAGDARYDPVGGGTSYPGLDVLGTSLTLQGDHLHVVVDVADPAQAAAAAQAVGAAFVDVVVRWEYQDTVYFASVEVPATGAPATFFDGRAQSVDLCSVSACDPHVITYPGPTIAPTSSHVVAGGQITAASAGSPGAVVLDVPVADVGGPRTGDRLASVGAYTLVSSTSALLPLPNPLAEADVVPVEVDGACCFTPILGAAAAEGGTPPSVVGATPSPTGNVLGAVAAVPNTAAAGTGAALPAALTLALGALGAVLRRRRRASR